MHSYANTRLGCKGSFPASLGPFLQNKTRGCPAPPHNADTETRQQASWDLDTGLQGRGREGEPHETKPRKREVSEPQVVGHGRGRLRGRRGSHGILDLPEPGLCCLSVCPSITRSWKAPWAPGEQGFPGFRSLRWCSSWVLLWRTPIPKAESRYHTALSHSPGPTGCRGLSPVPRCALSFSAPACSTGETATLR